MILQICVGSSCYLKGSRELVDLFQKEIDSRNLAADITLAGCFCTGKCNRDGVTVTVNDTVYTGVTPAGFETFFREHVLTAMEEE